MAAMTLPEPPFYTVPALAEKWSVHPDVIHAYRAAGVLAFSEVDLDGTRVPAVSYAEAKRFEEGQGADARPINPTERRTLLGIIGALARIAYVSDVQHVYSLTSTFIEDAARFGLPLTVSDETIANKFKESFALMRQQGAEGFAPQED